MQSITAIQFLVAGLLFVFASRFIRARRQQVVHSAVGAGGCTIGSAAA